MKINTVSNDVSLDQPSHKRHKQAEKKQLTVDSVTNWQLPLLAILFVAVVFVAIKTVVYRHESRTAFMHLQILEKERDNLAAQWSRLKLEQGAMLNQVRVERLARWDLKMEMPKASDVRIVREPSKVQMPSVASVSAASTSAVDKFVAVKQANKSQSAVISKVALSD